MNDDNYSMVVKVDGGGRKVFLPQFAKQFPNATLKTLDKEGLRIQL